MAEPAPVTAEGLRERIDAVVTDWATDPRGRHLADLVLAEFAGDPGDLPARMAEAIAESFTPESAVLGEDRAHETTPDAPTGGED